ncbi:MAG: hypothetical protein RJA98_352 [Pseudomonadota bacterium]
MKSHAPRFAPPGAQRPAATAPSTLRASVWASAVAVLVLSGCASTPLPPWTVNPNATAPAAPSPATTNVAKATPAARSATAQNAPSAAAAQRMDPLAAADSALRDAVTSQVLQDPLRPDARVEINDLPVHQDLWGRVRSKFGMPDLDNDLVRDRERWYASRPDYVQRMTERGGRYLFHVIEEVERRGLPSELALLPFIESAFNPQAMSSARASGMWQFMPATGRDFALRQNMFRDDRRDVLASTRAALDYLTRLNRQFGDWHLALAAYNWGEGNVQRAIARNQAAGLPTDYESLRMPDETRQYVPKLQAVKNIIAKPEAFSLTLPEAANHPYFLSVRIERDIDVDVAVKLAGVKMDDFRALNPQMNKPVILAAGTPQILLPFDNANQFVRQLALYRGQMATWTAWVAPTTLKTADAAKRLGMNEADLREINRIPPRMLVKAGSTLLVRRSEQRQADVPESVADNATMALAPEPPPIKKITVKAGKRETVASIAARYKLAAHQVAMWNKTKPNAGFKRGQAVVLWVPNNQAVIAAAPVRDEPKARAHEAQAGKKGVLVASKAMSLVERRKAAAEAAAEAKAQAQHDAKLARRHGKAEDVRSAKNDAKSDARADNKHDSKAGKGKGGNLVIRLAKEEPKAKGKAAPAKAKSERRADGAGHSSVKLAAAH